jgi:hypothetical protein
MQSPNSSGTANVIQAHEVMSDIYCRAIRVLQQNDVEPLQLMFHIDSVSSNAIPLLEALEGDDIEFEFQFPQAWLYNCAEMFD